MKILTIKIENDNDAELLKKVLQSTKFEDRVETFEEEEGMDDEELNMLEERWEKYEKNPASATSLEDFKKELKDKHGL